MKPVDVKDNKYIDFEKDVNNNDPNLKLVTMSEFLNTKIVLLKDTNQIDPKKFLLLIKLKTQFH